MEKISTSIAAQASPRAASSLFQDTHKAETIFGKEKNPSSLAKRIVADAFGQDRKWPLTDHQVSVIARRLQANKAMLRRWSSAFIAVMKALSELHENKSHHAVALLAVLEDCETATDDAQRLNSIVRRLRQSHYHHHFYATGGRDIDPRGLDTLITSTEGLSSGAVVAWLIFAKQNWFLNYWRRVMEDDWFDLIDELSSCGIDWHALSRAVPIVHEVQSERAISYLTDLGADLNATPDGHHVLHAMASRDQSAAPLVEELLRRGIDKDPAHTPTTIREAIAANQPRSAWLAGVLKDEGAACSRAAERLIARSDHFFATTQKACIDSSQRRTLSDLIKETGAQSLVKMSDSSQSDPTPWLIRRSSDQPFLSEAGARAVASLPK